MPEVNQINYSIKELTALMLRDQGIRSGLWMIWTKFGHTATNVRPPEGEEGPSGPAIVSILAEVGIQRTQELGPLAVDAAKIWSSESRKPPVRRSAKMR